MKIKFHCFILLMVLPFFGQAQAQWTRVHAFRDIRICLQNTDTLFMYGWYGTIARSKDGGQTWEYHNNPISNEVIDMCFVNDSTGYFTNYPTGLYKTTDDGCSWAAVNQPPMAADEYSTSIAFANNLTGWAVTNKGNIFKTSDGTATWQLQKSTGVFLTSVKCLDPGFVVVGTNVGSVYSSHNGGTTWLTTVLSPSLGVGHVCIADANTVYLAAGSIFKSSDGAASFQMSFIGKPYTTPFRDISFRDANYGLAVAENMEIYKTTNGGIGWNQLPDDGFSHTYFYNGNYSAWNFNIFVAVKGATEVVSQGPLCLKHEPQGNAYWRRMSSGGYSTVGSYLRYSHDGTAAFTDGKLSSFMMSTRDDGRTWQGVNNDYAQGLNGICVDNNGAGICVGTFGKIYNTLDNGTNWRAQLNPKSYQDTNYNLNDVQLLVSGKAWAVGDGGTILASADKGVHWTAQNSGVSKPLNSVSFADDNLGWAAGDFFVLHSSDGGGNWHAQLSNTLRRYVDINFTDQSTGWVVSNSFPGTDTTFLLKTTDGGSTWRRALTISYPYSYFTFCPLLGVDALNASEIRTYSHDSIYHSIDGGASWQSSKFQGSIRRIRFYDHNHGFIINDTAAYYTADAGATWNICKTQESTVGYVDINPHSNSVFMCGPTTVISYNSANPANKEDWAFQLQPRETGDGQGVFDFLDSLRGWKYNMIEKTVSYTSNGGKSWKVRCTLPYPPENTFRDMVFTTLNTGYATDNYGNYVKTSDGGRNWQTFTGAGPELLLSISFADSLSGFFAGQGGSYLRTDNGGTSYVSGHIASGEDIGRVFCTGKYAAWVSTTTKLFHTLNSGNAWTPKSIPAGSGNIIDSYFINDTTGWVLCRPAPANTAMTYGTTDGGNTWTATQVSSFADDVAHLSFTQNGAGIALSDGTNPGNFGLFILPAPINTLQPQMQIDTFDFCARKIRLSASSNIPNTVFTWQVGGASYPGSSVDLNLPMITDSFPITLSATADQPGLCGSFNALTATKSGLIVFDSIAVAAFNYDSTCSNTRISFHDLSTGVGPAYTYTWNFGDNDSSHLANPQHAYTSPGNYIPYLIVYSKNQCPSDTFRHQIIVGSSPVAGITKSNDIDCTNKTAKLTATPGFSYLWSPATGLSSVNSGSVTVNISSTQKYYLQFSTPDCTIKDSVTVFVSSSGEKDIFIPSAFTPNNDGKNDCISVKMTGSFSYFRFEIFNRYGEPVFATDNPSGCWDGYYKGIAQPEGNYVYFLKAVSSCGETRKKGNLLLLR